MTAKKKSAAKKPSAKQKAAAKQEIEKTEESTDESYKPKHPTLQNAGLDQHAAEKARQEQLAEEREVHNERTGDGGW